MTSGRVGRVTSAVLDQVISSIGNLLTIILVLRAGGALEFGAFSVALTAYSLLLGAMRSTNGDITILRIRRDPSAREATSNAAVTIALVCGLAIAAPTVALGTLIPSPLSGYAIAFGIVLPAVLLQDIQRYIAFAQGQPSTALRLDLVWLLAQVVLTVPVFILELDAVLVMYAWGLGALVSAGYGWCSSGRRSRFGRLREDIRLDQARAKTFLADYLLSTGLGQVAILSLSGIISLVAFGVFRLVLTIVGAITNVLGSTRSLVFAWIAGQRDPGPRTFRVWLMATTVSGAVVFGFAAALTLLPPEWGQAVVGRNWEVVVSLLLLAGAGEGLRVMAFPSIDLVRAHGSGRRLVATRTATGLGTAVALILGGVTGGVVGALTWLAGVQTLALAAWMMQAKQTVRSLIRR